MTELLSTEDAARIVGMSALTIRRAINEGDLKASKVRSQWRIHPDDLAGWIDQGRRVQASVLGRGAGVSPSPRPSKGAPVVGSGVSVLATVRARRNAA